MRGGDCRRCRCPCVDVVRNAVAVRVHLLQVVRDAIAVVVVVLRVRNAVVVVVVVKVVRYTITICIRRGPGQVLQSQAEHPHSIAEVLRRHVFLGCVRDSFATGSEDHSRWHAKTSDKECIMIGTAHHLLLA